MSTTAPSVAESNTAQLDAWDGGEGQYWAAHADEYATPDDITIEEDSLAAAEQRALEEGYLPG